VRAVAKPSLEAGHTRLPGRLVVLLAVAFVAPGAVHAQTVVDLSGAWALEVETDQGTTRPSWVLTQEGQSLSGTYSSEALGEHRLTGSVDGMNVEISFDAELQGQSIPVLYRGTLGEDGVLRGSIDIAGGMMQGRFSARRSDS